MDRTLDRLTTAILVGFSLLGLVTLALAMLRIFHVVSVSIAVIVVVVWVRHVIRDDSVGGTGDLGPLEPDGAKSATSKRSAIGAVTFAGLLTVFGLFASTEHYVSDRDPGVYLLTGAHIAASGGIALEAPITGFEGLDQSDDFGWKPMGFSTPTASGVSWPQFVHLLPSLLAVGHLVGGEEVAFRVTPLLSGFVLLGIYSLARGLVRDRWALVTMLTVGISVPFIHFGRDAHSELMVLTIVMAVVLLVREHAGPRRPPPFVDITIGLLLGSLFATRVDAMLYLPALAFVVFGLPLARGALILAGAIGAMAIGLIDLQVFSPEYAEALRPLSGQAWTVAGVLTVGVAAVQISLRSGAVVRMLERGGSVAGVGASVCFAGLWLVRPLVGDVHGKENLFIGKLQELEGARVVPTYNYAEESLARLGWYLGPVVLALAAVGAGLVVVKVSREAGAVRGWAFPLLMVAVPAVVYLWRPSITPDQPWAMRRQLLALVLVALLAGCSLDKLERSATARWGSGRHHKAWRVWQWAPVPIAFAVLAVPAWGGVPLLTSKSQRPLDEDLVALCTTIGPDAIAVLLPGLLVDEHYPLVLRRYCDIPAFAGPSPAEHDYASLGETASARSQRLVLVGSALIYADYIGPDGQELDVRTRELEPTIERKSAREVEWTHQLAVWTVETTR